VEGVILKAQLNEHKAAWLRLGLQVIATVAVGLSLWFGLVARVGEAERMGKENQSAILRIDEMGPNSVRYGHWETRLNAVEEAVKKLDAMNSAIARIDGTVTKIEANQNPAHR
jgi:hypothetical protein